MYILDYILLQLLKLNLQYFLDLFILFICFYTIYYLLYILYNLCALYSSYFNYGWAKYRIGYISYEKWAYEQLTMYYNFSPLVHPYLYCLFSIYIIEYNVCKIFLCIILQILLCIVQNIAFYLLKYYVDARLLISESNPSVRRLAGVVGDLIRQSELQTIQIQKLTENLTRWTYAINQLSLSVNQLNELHMTQASALKSTVKSIHDLHIYLLNK